MSDSYDIISARREYVLQSYNSASAENRLRFMEDDDKATAEYIFPNQMEDASNIVDKFYKNNRRVISIQKKTKVGADGLMIEIAKLLTTHIEDSIIVNPANVRIITGMSNAGWEKDMIDKAPNCFKDKIFHHGKLVRSDLTKLTNGLIIIDEIDTGDKEFQRLHTTLKEAGVLDVEHMNKHNNRFVFISATMIKELYDLYRWGDLHEYHTMIIPPEYIGHTDFLHMGIVREFYSMHSNDNAARWVQEDIIDHYGNDYRVHIVRVNTKIGDVVQNACIRKGVSFRNHTSTDRLSQDEIKELFKEPLTQHIVLGVKGFFRRANLIPNRWKLRIGATHELYTKIIDNSVQIQGLTGRMTGYWRTYINNGHKTGPHRTSIRAIEEYEKTYLDPYGVNSYQTAGFKKKKGKIVANNTMLSVKHIPNLEPVDLPTTAEESAMTVPVVIDITQTEFDSIKRVYGAKHTWDYSTISTIIQKYNPEIGSVLDTIEKNGGKDQIIVPVSESSYTTYISEFVKASILKKRRQHVSTNKTNTMDNFQIYLDSKEYRIIVSIYYGSKLASP
jgi:hypothetical protein